MMGSRQAAVRPWRLVGVAVAVLACVVSTGCTSGGNIRYQPVGGTASAPTETSAPSEPISLTLAPAPGAAGVSPALPITAVMTGGSLDTVTLVDAQGNQIPGDFGADHKSWRNSVPLVYNKSYTFAATGAGRDGTHPQQSLSFSTVKPKNLTLPYLRANEATLLDRGTFGVGQPVVVSFDEPIPDHAAAERMLTVTTEPAGIVGGWYWMNNHEVHWRPKDYWPSGTKVTVSAKVFGQNMGGGLYGQRDEAASFTIGQSKIAVADSVTHRMKVYVDGQLVTSMNGKDTSAGVPISMGKGGSEHTASGIVDFTTNSGPHVVMMKYDVYRMTSASFGITNPKSPNFYDTSIRKSIRISGDGEFVHLRDWDVYQIGNVNTSHGCINVGVPYINWIYDNFGSGDIVDVTGTNRHLDVHNGLGDWVVSWDQWLKGSALAPPAA